MNDLPSLLERVELANAPDRVLAREIGEYFGAAAGHFTGEFDGCTESLDAAIALVERVLPGWSWHAMNKDQEENDPYKLRDTPRAILQRGQASSLSEMQKRWFSASAPTPALAICAALLRAKIAETSHE